MPQYKQDFAAPAADKLLAGDFPVVTGAGTIASGAGALQRGTVLGRVTASGKLVKVDKSKSDGSQTVFAVLAENVDATSADATAPLYLSGQFAISALTFGSTDTAADHTASARDVSIFFTGTAPA